MDWKRELVRKNINEIEAETRTGEKMSMKMKLKPELVKEMS